MKELTSTAYIPGTYTDENTLYKNMLTEPVVLSANLTHLYGTNNSQFPLMMLTEGQGQIASIAPKMVSLEDTQYVWPVMGMMKHTIESVRLYNTSNTKPGRYHTPFQFVSTDNWAHDLYAITSPDGLHIARLEKEPEMLSSGEWLITATIVGGDPTEYVDPSNFLAGKFWSVGATSVAASKSDGTTSNSMVPGKMTNQYGFQRYSKKIAGNISNKVVPYQMPLDNGSTTTQWMPYEMKLWELERRMANEYSLWEDKYNRDTNGRVTLIDKKSNEPVPHGAGVKEVIKKFGYYDTYGPDLTITKINLIIDIVYTNYLGYSPDELVVYGGMGARKKFHAAITADARAQQYFVALGANEIQNGTNGFMSYGKYFDQYKTIHGKTITFKHADYFDKGPNAERDKKNGYTFQGLPRTSYDMFLLDHSADEGGVRNISLVNEKGREMITKIYPGMSPLPAVWGAAAGNNVSTTKDIASYEVFQSLGICMKRATTSFWLKFEL